MNYGLSSSRIALAQLNGASTSGCNLIASSTVGPDPISVIRGFFTGAALVFSLKSGSSLSSFLKRI